MEAQEREEDEAGAKITVKKKKASKGKSSFRQTKLASGGEKNSLEVTKPSPFAEAIEPSIPEFNANPKKPGGAGRKRVKAEAKAESSGKDEGGEVKGEETAKKPKLDDDREIQILDDADVRDYSTVNQMREHAWKVCLL